MSTHPNVMLMAHLSPQDLPRKTMLAILADAGSDPEDARVKIGEDEYHVVLFDDEYDGDWQITASPGQIVLMDMVTYGYGKRIEWDKLRSKHGHLAAWIEANAERYHLAPMARISVGANYW